MSNYIVDPIRMIVIKSPTGVDQVQTVQSVSFAVAIAADQSVVAAVTGQRIRVMGFNCTSTGAGSVVNLKNGAGGAILYRCLAPPVYTISEKLDLSHTGYFETSTSTALVVDGGTAAAALNLFYITYTP